jgi:hypothetical protein
MQFGVFKDDANWSFQSMLLDRLCVTASYVGGPIFQAWDKKIFRLNQRKGNYLQSLSRILLIVMTVPIIIVYTKYDLFMANNQRTGKGDDSLEVAEKHFYAMYGQLFAKYTKNIKGQIPYTFVSSEFVSPVA